jgi:hypothetical protein
MSPRFENTPEGRPQNSPSVWTKPLYSSAPQLTKVEDTSAKLGKAEITRLQAIIVGTSLLFYAHAIDSTMLVALRSLASAQSGGTQATAKAAAHLLNYAATHPDATLHYHASNMILQVQSDASHERNRARASQPPPLPASRSWHWHRFTQGDA